MRGLYQWTERWKGLVDSERDRHGVGNNWVRGSGVQVGWLHEERGKECREKKRMGRAQVWWFLLVLGPKGLPRHFVAIQHQHSTEKHGLTLYP